MKIAKIADTHFGCRKNSAYFMQHQTRFFVDFFFPYLVKNNIKTIFHAGDYFDNRKSLNIDTIRHAKECFIDQIIKHDMQLYMLVGNHDSFYKSNGELTSTKLLYDGIKNIHIFDSIEEMVFKTFY